MNESPLHPETAKCMLDILRAGELQDAAGHVISRVFVGPAVFAALSREATTGDGDGRPEVSITGSPNLMPNAAVLYTRTAFGERLLATINFGDEIKVKVNIRTIPLDTAAAPG